MVSVFLVSCDTAWLEVKRDIRLVVPESLYDLQALLNNTNIFNATISPSLGEVSADDYYLPYNEWNTVSLLWQKNAHIWAEDIFQGVASSANGWDLPYQQVFYTNVILEALAKLEPENKEWDFIKGTALFWRSMAFYQLAQVFCLEYDDHAGKTLGIPLPMESDINIKHERASLAKAYEVIINDLESAVLLLPGKTEFKTQPSQSAGYALLARVYLQIGEYEKAYKNADKALSALAGLMDYNTLNPQLAYPFGRFNQEVILETTMDNNVVVLGEARMRIDSLLYKSYGEGDLRKGLFYRNVANGSVYKGSYKGDMIMFTGLAADEVYLIKMECAARLGRITEAQEMLAFFVKQRWNKNIPLPELNRPDILDEILLQRRQQLVFRGLRWSDLKRFNKEGRIHQLQRVLNGKKYVLEPGSPKYALQIPPEVIERNSKIIQNPRTP